MSYFIWTTSKLATRAAAAKINKAVKAIDPGVCFVRHNAIGNSVRGWLERPNDGTNNQIDVRDRNAECVQIAESILG